MKKDTRVQMKQFAKIVMTRGRHRGLELVESRAVRFDSGTLTQTSTYQAKALHRNKQIP